MSESLEGVSVAVTRQNCGTLVKTVGWPADGGGPGGVNTPGATTCAIVTLAFGRLKAAIDSQDAANADAVGQREKIASAGRRQAL
jgi:hypothetical protein